VWAKNLADLVRYVREGLDHAAFVYESSTPQELGAFLKEQLKVWGTVAREAGPQATETETEVAMIRHGTYDERGRATTTEPHHESSFKFRFPRYVATRSGFAFLLRQPDDGPSIVSIDPGTM
jgi:hypothetical protein